jgi:predicted AAA+ superfamily ATPase
LAINNRDRVGKGFEILAEGLHDLVDEVMTRAFESSDWNDKWAEKDALKAGGNAKSYEKHDPQIQLRAVTEYGFNFKDELSRAEQGFASELREARNQWAHNESFSSDDAARILDTTERLLKAANAVDSADDVRKLRVDLQRTVFEEQNRQSVRKTSLTLSPGAGLKGWREVVRPHDDVARGEFNASEFAADLHLVATGEASHEYSNPVDFFSRTFVTEGLKDLLSRALRRISGDMNESPVVNLQTNFGGGKTHSMLALYHLFSGQPVADYPQEIQDLVAENGAVKLEELEVKRVALVGTSLKAGAPSVKADGTEVNTIWGELAWQLGGKKGFDIVAESDKTGTSPGDLLTKLFKEFSPAIILIDEWVAYARQLVGKDDLPAGTFDTQFTFAQALTEMVQGIPGVMLIVSVPASDAIDAEGQAAGSDIEIGGANGQIALDRLQNVVRRVADQWRPTSKQESFEIVRRRLFQNPDAQGHADIAAIAKKFVTLYRDNHGQFPVETEDPKYEARMIASYPIHPELFDRLYEDWSTLERFQRTRGVLSLMSAVVHELWATGDSSPMIMSGSIPLDEPRVNQVLTQYLDDAWKPIIDADIDGENAVSNRIDNDRPNLGQRHVTRRIARAIFMGSAPRLRSTRKGLEKQYLWLGIAMPGDAIGNFGSAIDLMTQRSTYFFEEQGHYWFDTQASASKTAKDYADRMRDEPEKVWQEVVERLQSESQKRGVFGGIHIAPLSSGDVPDAENVRLVVVHPKFGFSKKTGESSPAVDFIRQVIETKGGTQRIYRNTLVFAVGDSERIESLEDTVRQYLGWQLVARNYEALNLNAQQKKQADEWVNRTHDAVTDKISDAYSWASYPNQPDSKKPFEIESVKVDASNQSLAERVGAKLERGGILVTAFGPASLGAELSTHLALAWDQDDLRLEEVWGYFTRYTYLPKLVSRNVLDDAVRSLPGSILVGSEVFAVAESFDAEANRYKGLVMPEDGNAQIQPRDSLLIVRPAKADAQRLADLEAAPKVVTVDDVSATISPSPDPIADPAGSIQATNDQKTRFFGTVTIDPQLYGRDFTNLSREVLDRLAEGDVELEITVEIQAKKRIGFDANVRRTVTENAKALKFDQTSFEAD